MELIDKCGVCIPCSFSHDLYLLNSYNTFLLKLNPLFMHCLITWQTETIDLSDQGNRSSRSQKMFRRSNIDTSVRSIIDADGLPYVGQVSLIFCVAILFFSLGLKLTKFMMRFRWYNQMSLIVAFMMRWLAQPEPWNLKVQKLLLLIMCLLM